MDVVTNNFTDADNSVTTGHDLTVTVDAIQTMDGGNKRPLMFLVREMGQPGRDSTSSMNNVRINGFKQSGKFAGPERGRDNILRANVQLVVVSSVLFQLLYHLAARANNMTVMPK